jgi:glucose-6-phosphate 1-epimerase
MIDTDSDLSLVAADGARAGVQAHGAHVTSWRPPGSVNDRLFLSAASEFREGAAIRGGIPVIFPQFASFGPLPKHGFARTMAWQVASVSRDRDGTARLSLRLVDTAATRSIWPHAFQADIVVAVRAVSLTVALTITNTGRVPFTFTCALHTYLRVSDIRDVVVKGLGGARYRDSGAGGEERSDSESELHVSGEIDRIYFDVPRAVHVRDVLGTTTVSANGFPDDVVWNPGAERGAALADLELGGYARFICVEAAVVRMPIQLPPSAKWSGSQALTVA